jgi:hypothetical protein
MARRKLASRTRYAIFILAIAVIAAAAWFGYQHLNSQLVKAVTDKIAPVNVPADRIDPANEGHRVSITGNLAVDKPARDIDLDISADTPMLFRRVEMYQWREHCAAAGCNYAAAWSAQPVDSAKFHTPAGHENPAAPFVSARFAAKDIHLGAFSVDPELAATQMHMLEFPVRAALLPSNLAASFRDADGALYAGGGDPAHPAVGALRVSYRILPIGAVTLIGVQRGSKLEMR